LIPTFFNCILDAVRQERYGIVVAIDKTGESFGSPIPARAFEKRAEEVKMLTPGFVFHDATLFRYVLLSIAMSGYDAIATIEHIQRGAATEGNPLMESLMQHNVFLFFAVKMGLTALGLLVCYRLSHRKTARVGIKMIVSVYSIVCIYHALIVLFE
jgi:hypothetical protein